MVPASLQNAAIVGRLCQTPAFHCNPYRAEWRLAQTPYNQKIPMKRQRASPRIPPNRRAARVVSDFFAPLWTPTLFPPV